MDCKFRQRPRQGLWQGQKGNFIQASKLRGPWNITPVHVLLGVLLQPTRESFDGLFWWSHKGWAGFVNLSSPWFGLSASPLILFLSWFCPWVILFPLREGSGGCSSGINRIQMIFHQITIINSGGSTKYLKACRSNQKQIETGEASALERRHQH